MDPEWLLVNELKHATITEKTDQKKCFFYNMAAKNYTKLHPVDLSDGRLGLILMSQAVFLK